MNRRVGHTHTDVVTRFVLTLALLSFVSCGEGSDGVSHEFPAIEIRSGAEISEMCQSWTLDNDEPLFVTAVRATNGGSWHHSNWTFVPERMFEGPDGTWPCSERDYHESAAAISGGVLFAQSTQAASEEQRFPEGAALVIPPRSKIVGNVHLLNITPDDVQSSIRFTLETVAEENVEIPMQLMRLNIGDLNIAARSETEHSMNCNVAETTGAEAMDFRFYYVLPHYHELGIRFRLEALGGPDGPITVYETGGAIGDALGGTLDPPVDVTGATHLRMTCGWDNPRDESVGFGIGDQEMCVMLAFTDSDWKLDGGDVSMLEEGDEEGIQTREHECRVLGLFDRL